MNLRRAPLIRTKKFASSCATEANCEKLLRCLLRLIRGLVKADELVVRHARRAQLVQQHQRVALAHASAALRQTPRLIQLGGHVGTEVAARLHANDAANLPMPYQENG